MNDYGKIIAGINILDGNKPNNILSYIKLISHYKSFEEVYNTYNFIKYYIKSPLSPFIKEDGTIDMEKLII